jgi:MFS family permease
VGPDGPVYLWWSRLAGTEGLSATADRPGAPALSLVLEGTLALSVVEATAALEVVLGVAVGLASAALVRRRAGAVGSTLAGLLAGAFAVHLAAGYLANLVTAAAFLAAGALLDDPRRRAAVVAAFVLAGGGLAHPPFLLLSAAILLVAAALAWRSDRHEAFRIAGTAVGGAAVLGIGLLAVRPGAPPLEVDTSKDAFLRRAGLTSELRSAYLDRFVHRWTRYVEWVSVPLAAIGFTAPNGNAGRVLRSWFVLTFVGVAFALVTGWLPADRFVTFGFAIPILAALGLVRLWRRLERRRALAVVVTAALTLAMLAGSAIAWNRQDPFLSEDEVRALAVANEAVSRLEPGTPVAFLVNEPDDTVSFLATRAGNVVRAGVPPDRIRDVVVVVPSVGGAPASGERGALERLTARDLSEAEARSGRKAAVIVLTPFDDVDRPTDALVVDPSRPVKDSFPVDPLEASSAPGIAWASIVALGLLSVAGYGWARIGLADAITAAAAAPAVGAAMLILVATALDALGVGLGTRVGALAVSALAGGGGYLVRFVLERRAGSGSAPQVQEQPAE